MTFKFIADAQFEADGIVEALELLSGYFFDRAHRSQKPDPIRGCIIVAPPTVKPNHNPDGSLAEGSFFSECE